LLDRFVAASRPFNVEGKLSTQKEFLGLKGPQSHDVVLPTTTHGPIRLRCVTQPDPAQAALLDRLGIMLPKRMRLAEHELPALAISA
jgi:hypothetical protein